VQEEDVARTDLDAGRDAGGLDVVGGDRHRGGGPAPLGDGRRDVEQHAAGRDAARRDVVDRVPPAADLAGGPAVPGAVEGVAGGPERA